MAGKLNLKIRRGATYRRKFRWEVEPFVYKAITGMSNSAPLIITCVGHGLLPNQQFAIQSAGGMVELNDTGKEADWRPATVVDADHIELNRVNSSDYKAYTTGGVIKYRTVVDVSEYDVRMNIKTKVDGELLLNLTSAGGDFIVDAGDKSIEMVIADDAISSWKKGVYDIELVHKTTSEVVDFLYGEVLVTFESTTV